MNTTSTYEELLQENESLVNIVSWRQSRRGALPFYLGAHTDVWPLGSYQGDQNKTLPKERNRYAHLIPQELSKNILLREEGALGNLASVMPPLPPGPSQIHLPATKVKATKAELVQMAAAIIGGIMAMVGGASVPNVLLLALAAWIVEKAWVTLSQTENGDAAATALRDFIAANWNAMIDAMAYIPGAAQYVNLFRMVRPGQGLSNSGGGVVGNDPIQPMPPATNIPHAANPGNN